ncbi:MAG TPA: acyl-CoA thioesterase [Polyangiaceae bacterium]|nr:acyl-CoA thioesterase [Polyangiaceae bacterium]
MTDAPPKALRARRPADSSTSMTEHVLPTHANALGNVFGGQVLAWMDVCAAICAQRHCGAVAVTAGMDEIAFERPIKVGQVVLVEARVVAAFRTSVEIEVTVHGEIPTTGEVWLCLSGFMTFVAIDASGTPVAVPPLLLEGDERARAEDAQARRARRLARRRGTTPPPPPREGAN